MKIQKKLSACTSILVGKKAMADNSTIIARNEDAKTAWPKHLTVHEHKEFEEEQVFVSNDNKFTMPLPKVRFRYSATPEWTDKFGLFEEVLLKVPTPIHVYLVLIHSLKMVLVKKQW